ncbi:50S ribosomal protein L4 [Marinicella sp. W31]|uniref:50S ribosomal protein L4 n=1 Tax=Marinicella sp. W31 TaxID=3023713 RepID=UPI00375688BF
MELAVAGKKTKVEVSEAIFDRDYSEALVHQVVTSYQATGRAGTKAQKNRSAVSGGGAKPWKQKGTGRARAGTSRSPIWVGGGRAFAAQPRNFEKKVNTKMYRAALKTILSELNRQERLLVVADFPVKDGKTKEAVAFLNKHKASRAVFVAEDPSDQLIRATNNIHNVLVTTAQGIDPVSLVYADKVIVTVDSIKKIEEWLA